MIELYNAAGRWEERDDYTPKIGDIIIDDVYDTQVIATKNIDWFNTYYTNKFTEVPICWQYW